MPIETVSSPSPLSSWKPSAAGERLYFELYGETRPLLDTGFAEVLPAGAAGGNAQTAAATPIYEYWWTIGHPGLPYQVEHGRLGELFASRATVSGTNSPTMRRTCLFPARWRLADQGADRHA